jgi:hypothetical protein
MHRPSTQTSTIRRVAAILAALSVVLLLALSSHAHEEVTTHSPECAICSCIHHSDVAIPTSIEPIATSQPQVLHAAPVGPVLVTEHAGALPIPRAPPSHTSVV